MVSASTYIVLHTLVELLYIQKKTVALINKMYRKIWMMNWGRRWNTDVSMEGGGRRRRQRVREPRFFLLNQSITYIQNHHIKSGTTYTDQTKNHGIKLSHMTERLPSWSYQFCGSEAAGQEGGASTRPSHFVSWSSPAALLRALAAAASACQSCCCRPSCPSWSQMIFPFPIPCCPRTRSCLHSWIPGPGPLVAGLLDG